MRSLTRIAVLGMILCAPVAALADDGAGNSVGFGSINCEGLVSCHPTAEQFPMINANAVACIGRHFGFRFSPFDATAGLDGSLCLQNTSNGSNGGQTTGLTMSAHCCIVEGEDSSCHVQCAQIGSR